MTAPWIAAIAALWLLMAAVVFVLIGTLRAVSASIAEIREVLLAFAMPEITALAPGEEVEEFEISRLRGGEFAKADLAERAALVVFLSGHCSPCRTLASQLRSNGWPREGEAAPTLFLVVREHEDVGSLGLPSESEVLIDRDGLLAQRLASGATPHAFALHRARVVASLIPQQVSDLERLAAELERATLEEVAMA